MINQIKKNILLVLAIFSSSIGVVEAQQMPPIPVDKDVLIGTLPNGLTYYIRHNELPKNRAEFHIAQNVGAILEQPSQRGLAHFLEHMCFNGTTNFPGNEKGLGIIPWCESHGLKFGADVNAATGIDQTVYDIYNVPTENQGLIDSCLLILHDWSCDLLLQEEEIDKERGVILEELRTRDNAQMRNFQKIASVVYKGEKYEDCLPGGSPEVVANFPYDELRAYYKKWYRPDLQGIVVVGDIDPVVIEAKIKEIFADVKMPENAAERIYYPVKDNEEPIIAIATDKETTNVMALYSCKYDAPTNEEKKSLGYLVQSYLSSLMTGMLSDRLAELTHSPNPPFTYASVSDGGFLLSGKTKNAFEGVAICSEKDIKMGISTLLREMERARRFGFTASEYSRAKAKYLRKLESSYSERENKKNGYYAQQYIANFSDGEPIPSLSDEYTMINQIAPNIPVDAINQGIKQLMQDKNQVLCLMMPDKEGLQVPTEEELKNILAEVKAEELEPYEEKVSDEPLISEQIPAGMIVSESKDEKFGTTKLELSNGATVYLKHTDFKADEVTMEAYSYGGNSLYKDDRSLDYLTINEVATVGGLGKFSNIDLEKQLAGKKANVTTTVGGLTESAKGSCSPKDFETMLQLNYLAFTSPRESNDDFESWKKRKKASIENAESNPMTTFIDSIQYALYNDNPRVQRLTTKMVDQIDYASVIEMYKERFADAGDFTFIFVGNMDLEKAKPLIAQYIGGLPGKGQGMKEMYNPNVLVKRKGKYTLDFKRKQDQMKSTVFTYYSMKNKYSLKEDLICSFFSQTMTNRLYKIMREDEGGVYSPSIHASLDRLPQQHASLQVFYDTDPAKKARMMEIVREQMQSMATDGPTTENMEKARGYLLKMHEQNQKENGYWRHLISEYLKSGIDFSEGYNEIVKGINQEDVKAFAKKLLDAGNLIEVTMTSKKPEEK